MSSKKRLLAVLLVLWGVPIALAIGVGAWVSYAGTIDINVDERDGNHVHMKVPAALVDMVLPFIPELHCSSNDTSDAAKWMPVARNICSELDTIEDGVLVQVTGSDENVMIVKQGRNIVVDCNSDKETVHIVMPVRTISSVLSKCGGMRCLKLRGGASGV